MHCNTRQHPATYCDTLQLALTFKTVYQLQQATVAAAATADLRKEISLLLGQVAERDRSAGIATHCHHSATVCNTLQHTAAHCSTLQHTAECCNTMQHTAATADLRKEISFLFRQVAERDR